MKDVKTVKITSKDEIPYHINGSYVFYFGYDLLFTPSMDGRVIHHNKKRENINVNGVCDFKRFDTYRGNLPK